MHRQTLPDVLPAIYREFEKETPIQLHAKRNYFIVFLTN